LLRDEKTQALDYANLAEEIESLGRSDKGELGNRLHILVMHLLKWCYQPPGHAESHSWEDTIWHQRTQIMLLLGASAATPPHMWQEQASPCVACYPPGKTVGRRDRPRIGAVCPFVRLVSGGGDHITGDRPRPDPVWETASFSVPPASHGCPLSVSYYGRLL